MVTRIKLGQSHVFPSRIITPFFSNFSKIAPLPSFKSIKVNNAPAKQVALRASKRGEILAGYSLLSFLSLLDILHTS